MNTGKYLLVLAKKFFFAWVSGKIGHDWPKNDPFIYWQKTF